MTIAQDLQLTRAQAHAAYAAMRFVVEADGERSARGASLLEVAAAQLAVSPDPQEPSVTVGPLGRALLTAFASTTERQTLCHALIVAACIDGEVTAKGEASVCAIAKVLGVRNHWVDLLPALRQRRVFAVKRQLVRRSPDARRLFARTWSEDGLPGVWRALLFVLGVFEDRALAARFRALAALPVGSVGRTLVDDLRARGLALPGERGGLPERMIHHDLMHVIHRYGTDGAGECELAGFYAGCTPGDPFTFIVTVLTSFHLGMAVSPAIVTPARLAFDPARVVAAFLRGRRVRVDLLGPWDYWPLMPMPLEVAQRRLESGDAPTQAAVVAA